MTVYWDTSGIIRYLTSNRLPEIKGVTRTHTLAELFSTLSGRGIDTIKADGTIRHNARHALSRCGNEREQPQFAYNTISKYTSV